MNSWMPFNAVCDGTSLVDMIEKEKSRFKKLTWHRYDGNQR